MSTLTRSVVCRCRLDGGDRLQLVGTRGGGHWSLLVVSARRPARRRWEAEDRAGPVTRRRISESRTRVAGPAQKKSGEKASAPMGDEADDEPGDLAGVGAGAAAGVADPQQQREAGGQGGWTGVEEAVEQAEAGDGRDQGGDCGDGGEAEDQVAGPDVALLPATSRRVGESGGGHRVQLPGFPVEWSRAATKAARWVGRECAAAWTPPPHGQSHSQQRSATPVDVHVVGGAGEAGRVDGAGGWRESGCSCRHPPVAGDPADQLGAAGAGQGHLDAVAAGADPVLQLGPGGALGGELADVVDVDALPGPGGRRARTGAGRLGSSIVSSSQASGGSQPALLARARVRSMADCSRGPAAAGAWVQCAS
jgi:hypothetical protein